MKVTSKLLIVWEKRLPDLDSSWTHWWLEGDGYCIAVIPLENMSEAVDCIVKNHERFSSIFAYRAKIGTDGKPIREERRRAEIFNRINDAPPKGAV